MQGGDQELQVAFSTLEAVAHLPLSSRVLLDDSRALGRGKNTLRVNPNGWAKQRRAKVGYRVLPTTQFSLRVDLS